MKKLFLLFAAALLATAINAQQGNGGAVMNSNHTVMYSADASKLTKGKVTFAQGSSDKITMPVYKRLVVADNFGPEASIGSFTVYFDADRCQMVLQNNCNQPIMVKVSWNDGTTHGGIVRVSAGANQTGYNDMLKRFRGKSIYLEYARMRKCAGIGHDK